MSDPTRRQILRGAATLTAVGTAAALPPAASAQPVTGDERVRLWAGAAPGAQRGTTIVEKVDDRSRVPGRRDRAVSGVGEPVLVVRRPARPDGSAVLLMPGGGYRYLSYDNEGEEQAAWLTARGTTVFILLYRLPNEGWDRRSLVPLQDAQRAMRLIRAGAEHYAIDPRRVAVLGFSAGGHLAGSLATRHGERVYDPVDGADTQSARPDYAGLIYPVVSLSAPFAHAGSRDMLLGTDADAAARTTASVETRVGADTAPLFLAHAADDRTVPIANSLALYQAALAAARPAELHAFEAGGHGFGVRLAEGMPAAAWPGLFHAYGRRLGVFRG